MLRRLLTIWLIISTLGYGSAMATDLHEDETDESYQPYQYQHDSLNNNTLPDDNPDPEPQTFLSCDHCCHGAAHVVGIVAEVTTARIPSQSWQQMRPLAILVPRLQQPPVPPPDI
ncbi:MAG: hypothetical protein BMS9Abin26_2032 [Gammaproteobacteria bacterium]|nr:MAG: hypothetical protein BMS9Abin26_2032 [Gammaproteobacteria bacterium]